MRTVLDEIRREIDTVDKQLHNLLMKRADLVVKIGKEKAKKKSQVVHPGREAKLVKKILSAHKGPFHKKAIFKVWREIIGTCSLVQSKDMKASVTLKDNDVHYSVQMMELVKDYFGSVLPIKKVMDPQAALVNVKEGDVTFAVLPWPEDKSRPWWMSLIMESGLEHTPQIFGRLPFQEDDDVASLNHIQAALISSVPFEESGQDRSLVALAVNDSLSRGGLIDKMTAGGLNVNRLHLYTDDRLMKTFYLMDVDGFVTQDDEKLSALLSQFEDPEAMFYCLGGYPVPEQWN